MQINIKIETSSCGKYCSEWCVFLEICSTDRLDQGICNLFNGDLLDNNGIYQVEGADDPYIRHDTFERCYKCQKIK